MKLSTRSRYGVRMMLDLATHCGDKPVFLKDIAARENISEKYLSLIVIPLRSAGLIRSLRGARGGYVLARQPEDISLRHIVAAVDGETCLVRCVKNPEDCDRASSCATRETWSLLGSKIDETLESISLAQLVHNQRSAGDAGTEKK